MTSHIEVALGTYPELIDTYTRELLGQEVDELRKEKLVDKLKKIEVKFRDLNQHIYFGGWARPESPGIFGSEGELGKPLHQFLSQNYAPFGVQESTTVMSNLLEVISRLDDDQSVFTHAAFAFNDWWERPSQIMQPWRTKRIPLVYLHYRNVDGINVAGIDKLSSLDDLLELAKLYEEDKAEGKARYDVYVNTTLKSPALNAICVVLNHIVHVRQFNRFVKFLASDEFLAELREEVARNGITQTQLEDEFESTIEDINASLFTPSIDIRVFTLLRVIDLLLG